MCKECGETCSHGTKMNTRQVCRPKAPPTAAPADDVKWAVTWGIELALRDLATLRSIPVGAAQASSLSGLEAMLQAKLLGYGNLLAAWLAARI